MSRILLSGGPEPQGAERHWKPPSLGAGCTPGVRVWFLPKQYPSQRPCPPAPEAACDCPACIFALGAGISNQRPSSPRAGEGLISAELGQEPRRGRGLLDGGHPVLSI